jgi:hypothetical protein
MQPTSVSSVVVLAQVSCACCRGTSYKTPAQMKRSENYSSVRVHNFLHVPWFGAVSMFG